MATIATPTSGSGRSNTARTQSGFSLVEMMCVIAIVSLIASMVWPSVVGMVSGNRLTNNAYELSGLIQQARATAVDEHTYVWLGFSSTTQNGAPTLVVAGVMGNSGLSTDLQTGNYQLAFKPFFLKSVALAAATNYTSLPGVNAAQNTDAGSQTYSFQMNAAGLANATFNDVIVFGPDGQAYLPSSTGALGTTPVQCVGVGLNSAPVSPTNLHTVAVQVRGLSGQVSVFQQ